MVKARLIWIVLLATAVGAPGIVETEPTFTTGPECRSADCASTLLAQTDEGPALPAVVNDFRSLEVSGRYTVTSTGVLMPGSEGALRVIEFARPADTEPRP